MRRILVVVALVGVGLTLATPAQAGNCTGPIANTTINDNLVVPGGGLCELTNVIVNGSVTVQPNGSFTTDNATIKNGVSATNPLEIELKGGKIFGSLTVAGPTNAGDRSLVCGTDVTGNIGFRNSARVVQIGDEDGDECPAASRSNIGGNAAFTNNTNEVEVAGIDAANRTTIGGSLTLTGNTSTDYAIVNVAVRGSGTINDNGNLEFEGPTSFGGTLSCSGNTNPPTGGPVTAPSKTGQCAGL